MATKTWIGGAEGHEFAWSYEDNWDGGLPGENDIAVFGDGYIAQCTEGPLSATTIAGLVVSGAGALAADLGNLTVSGNVNISALSIMSSLTVLGETTITGRTMLGGGSFASIHVDTAPEEEVGIYEGTYGNLYLRGRGCWLWGWNPENYSIVNSIDAEGIGSAGFLDVQGAARIVDAVGGIGACYFRGDTELRKCPGGYYPMWHFYANATLRNSGGSHTEIYTFGDGHVQLIGGECSVIAVEGLLTTVVETSLANYMIVNPGEPPRQKTVRWISSQPLSLDWCVNADIEFYAPCMVYWVGGGAISDSTCKLMRPEATLTWHDVPIIPAYTKGEPVLVGA